VSLFAVSFLYLLGTHHLAAGVRYLHDE